MRNRNWLRDDTGATAAQVILIVMLLVLFVVPPVLRALDKVQTTVHDFGNSLVFDGNQVANTINDLH